MLNKLSFNLMQELNESETKKYKINKKVIVESDNIKTTINEEDKSFEDIIWDMEIADDYESLRDAASYIADINLKNQVYNLIDICENDGDDVATCYSIVTSDLLDNMRNELNEANNSSKEDRLASLKMQLEKDGNQLAQDEKEAIEKEITDLEKEVYNESCKDKLNERYVESFGGDASDFISDVQSIVKALESIDTSSFSSKLATQMVDDWIDTCNTQISKAKRLESEDEFQSVDESSIDEVKQDSKEKGLYTESVDVKNLKTVKSQGNVYMLESSGQYIIGENYNESEKLIENAEIYKDKEEADKDYLSRCGVTSSSDDLEEGALENLKLSHLAKNARKANDKYQKDKTDKNFSKVEKSFNKLQTATDKARDKIYNKRNKTIKTEYNKINKADEKASKANEKLNKVSNPFNKVDK